MGFGPVGITEFGDAPHTQKATAQYRDKLQDGDDLFFHRIFGL